MNPVFSDVFTEMAVLLLLAAVIGAIGVRLRQPLIVAFIAVGILVGPSVLGWVSADDQVDLLAQLGIALLLFVVGLKLDLHIIRTMHHGSGGSRNRAGAGFLYLCRRLLYRHRSGDAPCDRPLCGGSADLLQHHHHRQAAV